MQLDQYLTPSGIFDYNTNILQDKLKSIAGGAKCNIDKSKKIFYFVRDEIKYNPYLPRFLREHFKASNTLRRGSGFCIQKAVLLIALSRALGIPARLGFTILRNHLLPAKMMDILKVNVLPDHGYAELWLDHKWIKATPAFDLGMCQKNGIIPVEFDGINDAKFHSYTLDGRLHIEYLYDRGSYDDVPIDEIREWDTTVLKPSAISTILGS